MQTLKGLRFLLASLLLFSAFFHLIIGYTLLSTEFAPSIIDFVFGFIYVFLGIGVLVVKRVVFYFCIPFGLIDGIGGVSAHIASQALAPLVAASIDVVIIVISILILIKKKRTP